MFTPSRLAEQKLTLDDLAVSAYDHERQVRESLDPKTPFPVSDTLFDGEQK
jgi:hypothetical protein